MSIRPLLSERHIQVVRLSLMYCLAKTKLAEDDRDAAKHALGRVEREMAKHRITPRTAA